MDPAQPRVILHSPPSVPAHPPLPGTWVLHSLPRVPACTRRWSGEGVGPRADRIHVLWAQRVPAAASASLTRRFGGDQGSRSADRGHQGRAQRPVPLHGRRRQDARAGTCLPPGVRAGARDLHRAPGQAWLGEGGGARRIESGVSSLSPPVRHGARKGRRQRARLM